MDGWMFLEFYAKKRRIREPILQYVGILGSMQSGLQIRVRWPGSDNREKKTRIQF